MIEMDKEIIELRQEIRNLKAVNEIERLMAHYEILHNQKNMSKHPMDFALTRNDVSVQIADSVTFKGPEGIKKLFGDIYDQDEETYKGIMLIHYLTTPSIVVAEDGNTARGLWWTPGIETIKREKGSKPEAAWCFGAYANDFIIENDKWKIWHMRFILTSKCSYKDGWADDEEGYRKTAPVNKELPETWNPYSKTYIQESIPMTPEPYETWNDEKWYLKEE